MSGQMLCCLNYHRKEILINPFCLKIRDLLRHPTHGWVCGWSDGSVGQWVESGEMNKNLINLDIIKMIQFCLKIYNL